MDRRCPIPVSVLLVTCVLAALPAPPCRAESQPVASAEEQETLEELERRVAELEKIVAEQQEALRKLLSQPSAVAATPPAPPPPAEAPLAPSPVAAAPAPTSNYFNPSISVIGNFLAVGGHNPTENLPSAELRESELSFQAVVDPYARADFFLSFGEEGVDVEEGFATFTSLPWKLLVKVGRLRSYFGKVNTLHLHVLPWPDAPLNVVNLLGGEEGWIGTGVSIARLIPLPGDTFSELTVQAFRGDADGLFESSSRGDLAYNGHYRVFSDLSESVNLDAGFSYALGPNDSSPDATTRLEGLDATLRCKPLRRATYRSTTFRGEYFRSHREQPGGDQDAKGWFVSGDFQVAQRWFLGARGEAADRGADASLTDRGLAALVTFWPSEFSQLRGELRRREYAEGVTANELLLQIQFAIGAHGAHPF